MTKNSESGDPNWIDPDDAPELDAEWFRTAEIRDGDKIVRRGRPPVECPKQQVTVRLDADLVEELRASGPGWQTRMNDAVRHWLHGR